MLEPAGSRKAWREWRAGVELTRLDGECLAVLPLLSGRLREWLPEDADADPAKEIVLGICKRAWAQNQLRYRETAGAIDILRQEGVDVTIFGPVAWSLLYQEEKAVRPIETLDFLAPRDRVNVAVNALQSAGWTVEPDMPPLAGRVFDTHIGIWLRSPNGTPCQLAWRLSNVSPELARSHEATPARRPLDLVGTQAFVVQTEELFVGALTREHDRLVNWQCDAVVLLRNRTVEWRRLRTLTDSFPAAVERLSQVRREFGASIPPEATAIREPGPLVRRYLAIRADYRRVCWAEGRSSSPAGLARYALWRASRRNRARTP
jgi:hypothetical protein